jgi:hypothetical protein
MALMSTPPRPWVELGEFLTATVELTVHLYARRHRAGSRAARAPGTWSMLHEEDVELWIATAAWWRSRVSCRY